MMEARRGRCLICRAHCWGNLAINSRGATSLGRERAYNLALVLALRWTTTDHLGHLCCDGSGLALSLASSMIWRRSFYTDRT